MHTPNYKGIFACGHGWGVCWEPQAGPERGHTLHFAFYLILAPLQVLRNHVMVRVGGGWDTLGHYLDKHDPCRCTSLCESLASPLPALWAGRLEVGGGYELQGQEVCGAEEGDMEKRRCYRRYRCGARSALERKLSRHGAIPILATGWRQTQRISIWSGCILAGLRSGCDVHSGGTKHDLEGSLVIQ